MSKRGFTWDHISNQDIRVVIKAAQASTEPGGREDLETGTV